MIQLLLVLDIRSNVGLERFQGLLHLLLELVFVFLRCPLVIDRSLEVFEQRIADELPLLELKVLLGPNSPGKLRLKPLDCLGCRSLLLLFQIAMLFLEGFWPRWINLLWIAQNVGPLDNSGYVLFIVGLSVAVFLRQDIHCGGVIPKTRFGSLTDALRGCEWVIWHE